MNTLAHGLTIEISRVNDEYFLMLKAVGTLTHKDYKKITPMIDVALASVKEPKVKVFIDVTKLEGWEARAACDDFKLGLKHGNEFSKIAIYGNKKWEEYILKFTSWFISGELKYFENKNEAFEWLKN